MDEMINLKDVIKPTFSAYDTIKYPTSNQCCVGCQLSMNEKADIELIDNEKRFSQKMRQYSWVLTETKQIAATKHHIKELYDVCINPPKPPFSIILSDSGQKHFIYRTPINNNQDYITIRLEDWLISYEPNKLIERMKIVKQLVAALGKPALEQSIDWLHYKRLSDHYEGDTVWNLLEQWINIQNNLLTKLALWLSPNKEVCSHEYQSIKSARISIEDSGDRERGKQFELF